MYVRRTIRFRHLLADSRLFLVGVTVWSVIVLYVNEYAGYHFISIPIAPVTIIGIAVSLYLGFKSTSAYNRWWEARQIWGAIVNFSRIWGNNVLNLMVADDGRTIDPAIRVELIRRHIAWVNALAWQLRGKSRLKVAGESLVFGRRRVFSDPSFHQTPESYRRFLPEDEIATIEKNANVATHLLRRQGDRLRTLAEDGFLDAYRHVAMMGLLDQLYGTQGRCERIKNTPFPRQIANFGLMFTWVLIFVLPLALVDVFENDTRFHSLGGETSLEYMFVMIPFAILISWVFFIMERVSDSTEDPFEGGVTDVPISALSRVIEIDLKQMIGAKDVPEPLQPVDGVLY